MSVVANVAINVDSRDAVSKLRQVEQASSKLDQTYQDLNGRLRDANGRFVKAGDAAQAASGKVNILGNAVKNLAAQLVVADLARRFFKGFDEAEKAAAAVRTLGVDSKVLEGQLLGVSNRLGGLYSQTQLLAASYDVASAGFANAADNAKILEASAKGATGGLSDINTVADAVTSVLNAYGKSAAEAGMLVDGFIQTQNDGKLTLNQYAEQIGKLAPTAAAAGVGIQELNAAVATITPQGVQIEAAVAGLNQALVAILKPSKEASDLAEALGIDFNEAGLRAKGFGGLLQEVKEKTGGSTTALVQLFGSVDALKAVLPLVNDDLVKYNQNVQKQADVSGVADKATQELGGTVSAEVSKMINQIGNLTRSLDTVLGPALGGIVKLINVIIGEATRGINVLGQLFSLGKNTTILKGALESGDLRGASAARVIPGIDELIGQQRRQQLQRQAGAGTGFLGAGFNAQRFAELLKQQPEIKRLLGAGAAPTTGGGAAAGVDPAIQAILDGLGESGNSRKGKTDAEKAAQEEARLQARLRGLQIETQGTLQLALIKGKIAEAEMAGNKELAIRLQGEQRNQQILLDLQSSLEGVTDEREKQALQVKALADLEAAGIDTATEMEKLMQDRAKSIQDVIGELEFEQIKMLAVTDAQKQAIQFLQIENQLKAQGITLTDADAEAIRKKIAEIQKLTKEQQAANDAAKFMEQQFAAIGSALGDQLMGVFDNLINKTKSWNQVLRDSLMSVGKILMMAGLNMLAGTDGRGVLSFLGFGSGFGQRATGGPVTGNTPYVVGERGPELFVPGTGGTVVNNNDLRSAMGTAPGSKNGPVLNMTFQTTNIGGMEYVSRDQLEAAMAATRKAAANDGARQGTAATLSKLQQSPSTRAKLGLR